MNRTVRRVSVVILCLVLALLVRVTWMQVVNGQALAEDDDNRRNAIEQYGHPFGDIIVGGKPVTGSKEVNSGDFKYKRTYSQGELYSAVTGYSSQARGSSQLESLYEDVLDGKDDRLKDPMDALTGDHTKPGNVITTIDPKVQKAGFDALGKKKGAAVAVDPSNGEIQGMVSTPSFDPSKISGGGDEEDAAWDKLSKDKNQPMLNRALRQPVPPGSTFKLVVAAAALEDGLYSSVDEKTDSPDPYTLKGTTTKLENESKSAPCKNASIRTALRYSCNTVFAKLATDLGGDKVRAQAEKFGFNNKKQDTPVRAYKSIFPKKMDAAQTGLSGIGQYEVTATPLQMTMISQAIANDGELNDPHMVSQVQDSGGTALQTNGSKPKRVLSDSAAKQLKSAMKTVVDVGTGTNAKIPGMTVGGKTGTAQHGVDNSGKPYAWFTTWAENSEGKKLAVAAVVEDSDAQRAEISGSGLAAPVAKRMIQQSLG